MTSASMPITEPFKATENAKVLIVDDNVDLLKLISIRLKPMNFDLKTVTSAEEALGLMSLWLPDLIVTDLQMPGLSGMELFEKVHAQNPLLPIIILTAHGTIPEAVRATQSGVASYLTKPFDSEALVKQIQISLMSSGFTPSEPNRATVNCNEEWRKHIVSKSPIMEAVLDQAQSLADTDALILLEGESGTGKDALASAIHKRSHRATGPLIQLSCTSVPNELLEAETFGKAGSSMTDKLQRKGLLDWAHGGTLIVSDFNESRAHFLHRLLKAVIEKKSKPIDSDIEYSCNVRVIATTALVGRYDPSNSSLWNLASKLDITTLTVPSLEERREDIPLIISHCLSTTCEKPEFQFSNKALQLMLAADWPGNIHQLINVTKQCARLTKTKIISEALVQSRLSNRAKQVQPLSHAHRDFERN